MGSERPEHRADVFHRMAFDRQAAQNDDAAALLDLVEQPLHSGVERRVAAVFGPDFTKLQAQLAELAQDLLQSTDLLLGEVECDVLFADITAAPGHRMIDLRAINRGHAGLLSKPLILGRATTTCHTMSISER